MDDGQLLEHIKSVNRISTDDIGIRFELDNLIESAKIDLKMSGVRDEFIIAPYEPIIIRAIALYTKANFGFDNPDSDKLTNAFRSLELHLALSSDYGVSGIAAL